MRVGTLLVSVSLFVAACGTQTTLNDPAAPWAPQGMAPSSAPAPEMSFPRPPAGDTYRPLENNAVMAAAEQPVSTISLDVDTASYANVRRFLREGRLPPADAVRIEELVNYFDYGYAVPESREAPFRPTVALYPSPWRKVAEVLHVGIKTYDLPQGTRPKVNLVFLIDTSGSMAPDDRLPLLQRSFRLLVNGLRDDDRVSIVTYASDTKVVLPPTAGSQKHVINPAIEGLKAGGGTAGGAGIQLAYEAASASYDKDAVNRVILATDGDFNVGITDPKVLTDFVKEKRRSGIYLSILGVGRGNYRDATMQRLAQSGNGVAAYIDTFDEARKVLARESAAALLPVADDVKVQVEFNPARIREWRLIGYETRLLRRQDFSNDSVDAGDIGAGKAVTALYEIVREGAPGALTEPLRYGTPVQTPASTEDAYVRIRYKTPGATASRLLERPVTDADRVASAEALPADLRFAAAVAGFGQVLRDDATIAGFSLRDARRLAANALGTDPWGDRQEFVRLVDAAMSLKGETQLGSQ